MERTQQLYRVFTRIKSKSIALNILSYSFVKTEFHSKTVSRGFRQFQVETYKFADVYFYPFKRIEIEYQETILQGEPFDALLQLPDTEQGAKRFAVYSQYNSSMRFMSYDTTTFKLKEDKHYTVSTIKQNTFDGYFESRMILTGPTEAKILILIIFTGDYEFFYFDMNGSEPLYCRYKQSIYAFDAFISLEGFNHRYYLGQQQEILYVYRSIIPEFADESYYTPPDENIPLSQQSSDDETTRSIEIYPKFQCVTQLLPVLRVPFKKQLWITYLNLEEIKMQEADLSPGTYCTVAISEYKSREIKILRITETFDYQAGQQTLQYTWLKSIELNMMVNYSMLSLPSDPKLMILIGEIAPDHEGDAVRSAGNSAVTIYLSTALRYSCRLLNIETSQSTTILEEKEDNSNIFQIYEFTNYQSVKSVYGQNYAILYAIGQLDTNNEIFVITAHMNSKNKFEFLGSDSYLARENLNEFVSNVQQVQLDKEWTILMTKNKLIIVKLKFI